MSKYGPNWWNRKSTSKSARKFGRGEITRNMFGIDFCTWCGTTENLHMHHFVPIGKGGDDSTENRMPLCWEHSRLIHKKPKEEVAA